jgi:hypothetical protein
VTRTGRYVAGVSAVVVLTIATALLVPVTARTAVWVALAIALVVQAPLGWWLIRNLGTERFLLAWAGGILARFATLALAGLVIVPRLGVAMAPTLFALVAILMALVAVELTADVRSPSPR